MTMTEKTSLPLPPWMMTAEMTTAMMPATMMSTRGRKSARRYKRKGNFRECSKGESGFGKDFLLPQKFCQIYLPLPHEQIKDNNLFRMHPGSSGRHRRLSGTLHYVFLSRTQPITTPTSQHPSTQHDLSLSGQWSTLAGMVPFSPAPPHTQQLPSVLAD
jgi:hypothetical protein